MDCILTEFDPAKEAVVNPDMACRKISDFPALCLTPFSHRIMELFTQMPNAQIIAYLFNANGRIPIYKILYHNVPVAVYQCPVGAPSAIGNAEEVAAMGAEVFLAFGSCGVLRKDIADGHVIIPESAVRDEGISYHYAPPSAEIALETETVAAIQNTLTRIGCPHTTGKIWTTDAFYRETPQKVQRRREMGCIAVEMECASFTAWARFRGLLFGQLLYAADNLDSLDWEPRGLSDQGFRNGDQYIMAALECGLELLALRERQKKTKSEAAV